MSAKELRSKPNRTPIPPSIRYARVRPRRFFAKHGNPAAGCDFLLLVDDVCGYDKGPFVHPTPEVP